MTDNEKLSELGTTDRDISAALLRSAFGAVPFAGQFLVELITFTIPEQREDRICKFLKLLAERLGGTEQQLAEIKATLTPEKVALFEDGAIGSRRATTDERIAQLADLIAGGLTANERKAEEQRAIVRLLNELTDFEMRYLMSRTKRYGEDENWLRANGLYVAYEERTVVSPDGQEQLEHDSVGDKEMDEVAEHGVLSNLVAKGLLTRGGSGTAAQRQPMQTRMTNAGRNLLRRLGLLGSDEQ